MTFRNQWPIDGCKFPTCILNNESPISNLIICIHIHFKVFNLLFNCSLSNWATNDGASILKMDVFVVNILFDA